MISLYTDCLALYFVKERDAMTQPKSDLAYLRSEKPKRSSSYATTSTVRKFWNIRYRS